MDKCVWKESIKSIKNLADVAKRLAAVVYVSRKYFKKIQVSQFLSYYPRVLVIFHLEIDRPAEEERKVE